MASLDTLTRKLEETHEEIVQVRGEVVEALRSFYASSSAISIDAAIEIAAKWGAGQSFPMEGDATDASGLQEKMKSLNGALLDAVDRLQLDESGEMAPEAQLLLAFTQRDKLRKQVQQSKAVLALIEQLTEIDRVLGDVDEAINHQRFVAAAGGVAEVERLLTQLAEAEKGENSRDDKKIIRVVQLQLLNKKNRLLNQLTRYFECTTVWKDNALKVTVGVVENEFESTKLSMKERRSDFWKACDVLDIVTPKLKDIAKAISQHLIKPMLLARRGSVQQSRDDTGVTLEFVMQNVNGEVVSVEKLFAGNAELMNQLGEFMWKIPGNLEAQLMNLLQDKIPQEATALDAYREVLMTAIASLENTLVTIGFSACGNSQLRGFVDQLNQCVAVTLKKT
ncbi:hypothetical protein PHPALM_29355 [Phytophthora palmivora]|uniref:Centromere/kinetochore protein n=1 Tax=Phytophthora palmivora TaxID=4796 RepID=A0A2P4X7S3_9STRA|nr:hypothetical protein PHPALM_29355 [Phytophthora palmivora]